MKKSVLYFFITLVFVFGFYYYSHFMFEGRFEIGDNREKCLENFIKNEKYFSELTSLFNANVSKGKFEIVTFGVSGDKRISLSITPTLVSSESKLIGGNNLALDSPNLDSALLHLGWTRDVLNVLLEKLLNTNCNWVRTTEIYGSPIEIYGIQKGWGNYSFYVFDVPVSDSLKRIHGNPISDTAFGSRVVLNYSTAL